MKIVIIKLEKSKCNYAFPITPQTYVVFETYGRVLMTRYFWNYNYLVFIVSKLENYKIGYFAICQNLSFSL